MANLLAVSTGLLATFGIENDRSTNLCWMLLNYNQAWPKNAPTFFAEGDRHDHWNLRIDPGLKNNATYLVGLPVAVVLLFFCFFFWGGGHGFFWGWFFFSGCGKF